jgi:TonB family protein
MKLLLLLSSFLLLLFTFEIAAQQTAVDKGIALYKSGDDAGAIHVLSKAVREDSFKADAEAWNTLGLAYLAKPDLKKACEALERAVQLKPAVSAYHANLAYAYLRTQENEKSTRETDEALRLDPKNAYAAHVVALRFFWMSKPEEAMSAVNTAILFNPRFGAAYLLRSDILISMLGRSANGRSPMKGEVPILADAIETLKIGIRNAESDEDKKLLQDHLVSANWFYAYYAKTRPPDDAGASSPSTNVTPYKVTYQPKAIYSDSGRSKNIQGSVRLAILLQADGTVGHILKLSGLGYGLDEEAIKAAKKIKFVPRMVDGKPVAVVIVREYTFTIF